MEARDATFTDIGDIRRIVDAAWRDTYVGLLSPATIESFLDAAYSTARVKRRIELHTFLVVESDEAIVGFADAVDEGDRLNLAAIYADPARRGQGAGTLLVQALRDRFPGRPIIADVLLGNRKGEAFYEHRGFVAREAIEEDLFGELVIERRWWLDDRLDP